MTDVHSSASSIDSVESQPLSDRHLTSSRPYFVTDVSGLANSHSNPNIPTYTYNGGNSQLLQLPSSASVHSGINNGASSIAATDGSDIEYQNLIDANSERSRDNEYQDDFSLFNRNAFNTQYSRDHATSHATHNNHNKDHNNNNNDNHNNNNNNNNHHLGVENTPENLSKGYLLDSTSVSASISTDSENNVPSRPLSRVSTLSGVSTTANLDGIEGNRINKNRVEYPMSYSVWNNCQEQQVLDKDKHSALKKLIRYSRTHFRPNKDNECPNGNDSIINNNITKNNTNGFVMNRSKSDADLNHNSDLDLDDDLHGSITPEARLDYMSQEPVTLNEKIRLLGDVQTFDASANSSMFSLPTRNSVSSINSKH